MRTLCFPDLSAVDGLLDLGFVRSRLHAPGPEPWDSFARTERVGDERTELQGAMLTVALQRLDVQPDRAHDVFGCFTVADAWTFLRGRFRRSPASDGRCEITVEYHPSRELSERTEAEAIASILKSIVAQRRKDSPDLAMHGA